MGLDEMFSGGKKTFTIISMIVLLIGLIGDFVTTIIWWNRIQPWFSHGKKDGLTVYQCVLACWVLSMIGVVAVIIFLIFILFVGSICDSITNNSIVLIVCIIIVGGVSVGSIVSGAYGSSYALKNPGDDDEFDADNPKNIKNKCAKYFTYASLGISEYIAKHPDKYADFMKWSIDFSKHMIKNEDETNWGYICMNVGLPTMIFALVQCVAIVLFIIDIIISFNAFSKIA